MPLIARVCHATSGRLRIRIDARRRDAAYFAQLAEKIGRLPGIRRVEPNALTGTVLILHTLAQGRVRSAIESFAGVSLAPEDPQPSLGRLVPAGPGKRHAPASAGIPTDTRGLAILALLGLAIHQAIEGNVMVPAVSLLWYAFNLFERGDGTG
jgi:hypothetical protein